MYFSKEDIKIYCDRKTNRSVVLKTPGWWSVKAS